MTTHRQTRRATLCALSCSLALIGMTGMAGCAGSTPTQTSASASSGLPAQLDPQAVINRLTFEAYSAEFIDELMALNPGWAAYLGKYDQAARMTVPNAADRQRRRAFIDTHLSKLEQFNPNALPASHRADHQIIRHFLESQRWQNDTLRAWQWNPAQYNVAQGFSVLLAADYAPARQKLRDMTARLRYVPAYYAAAKANIDTPTLEHTELAMLQNRGALGVFERSFEPVIEQADLPPAELEALRTQLAAATTAVSDYIDWLRALKPTLTGAAVRDFRLGETLYEPYFSYRVNVGGTAKELNARAMAERDRLHADMAVRADRLWPTVMGDAPKPADKLAMIDAVIDALSVNHASPEDFVDEVRAQIRELESFVVEKDLIDLDPTRPLTVRLTPEYKRGVASASVDAPGPFDPTAQTYYNVSPLDDFTPDQAESFLREYNDWVLEILNIHEAVPGHYTQLVFANKSPSLVKSILRNGAMIEGWAVYTERMMLEAGYGQPDPVEADKMWLMYGKWNLRVVCNTILDYGVHVNGMTEAEALDLLTRQAFQTQTEAEKKWRRVTLSQVQLTSYYAGFDAILQLRAKRKAALGADFDLKRFHHRFLGYGSAPVPVIADLMAQQYPADQ